MPASLALVFTTAGPDRADALAKQIGVADWSSRHNSDAFQQHPGAVPLPARSKGNDREIVGVPVALTAEVYSNNCHSQAVAYADSKAPVRTCHSLLVLPEKTQHSDKPVARVLPALKDGPSAKLLDKAQAAVEADYLREAAAGSARIMEYPSFQP